MRVCVTKHVEIIWPPPWRLEESLLFWVSNNFFYWHSKDYCLPETCMYRNCAENVENYVKKWEETICQATVKVGWVKMIELLKGWKQKLMRLRFRILTVCFFA